MRRWGVSFLLFVLALQGGCSRSVEWLDARDRGEPLIKRARAKRTEGDIDGAIALYREALKTEQRMALANLDLALLLHDEKKDYLGAVCHYTSYLETRPETQKSEMIRKRRQLALQALVASLAPEGRSARAGAPAAGREDGQRTENTELATALQRLRKEQDVAKAATAHAEELAVKNTELESALRRLQGEVDELRAVSGATFDAAAAGSRERPKPAQPQGRRRTYEVMPGDSLSSIAAAVYGDGAKWKTIYEANQDLLGRSSKLRVGQVLVIP